MFLLLFPQLKRDGDKLMGRGVTDCLGHVALLAEVFATLGAQKPALKRSVIGVWIANEENSKVRARGREGRGGVAAAACMCL